jgi:hypothetical protein
MWGGVSWESLNTLKLGTFKTISQIWLPGVIGFRGFPDLLKLNRGIRWPEEHIGGTRASGSCSKTTATVEEHAVAAAAAVVVVVAVVVEVAAAAAVRAVTSVK